MPCGILGQRYQTPGPMKAQNPSSANALRFETSPYLLQHADNPVHWYPWGEEALELARAENKPICLSIGYSACHWCHVMAHESFEDDGHGQGDERLVHQHQGGS